ncbi:MAG: hypothetical protein RIC55_00265 [Pirellulaceae bacterium]
MNKPDAYQWSIFAGIVLLLIGVQLRLVDSYVLNPTATGVLARITGPPAESPQGSIRQLVVETTSPKKQLRPWPWLGWACLSLGTVLTSFGVMHKWRKK